MLLTATTSPPMAHTATVIAKQAPLGLDARRNVVQRGSALLLTSLMVSTSGSRPVAAQSALQVLDRAVTSKQLELTAPLRDAQQSAKVRSAEVQEAYEKRLEILDRCVPVRPAHPSHSLERASSGAHARAPQLLIKGGVAERVPCCCAAGGTVL
jgi:hypothetical protein